MGLNPKTTALSAFIDSEAPICYGILKPGEHIPTGIPVIKVKNIIDGKIIENDLLRTTVEIHEQYKRAEVKTGDVLLTIRGTTGRVAIVPDSLSGANITQDTARIRVSSKDNGKYVFYALQSPYTQQQISLNTVGQAVKGINIAEVKKLKIFHPPESEQSEIAKILSTWDQAISTTEQLLANSQQQKKALMQQLLTGKKRLLDKNGVRFSGEWKQTAVIRMGKVVSGGTPDTDTKEYWDGDIKWLTPTDVTALTTRFVFKTSRTISKLGIENSSATMLPKGSLMVCTRATIGAMAIATTDICTNQGFKNLVPNNKHNVDFLYYLLSFNTKELFRKASGSTFLELSKKDFEKIALDCPNLDEQQKIASVLASADQEIETLQRKLDYLKQEKKALVQQLLTGKRRVNIEQKELHN